MFDQNTQNAPTATSVSAVNAALAAFDQGPLQQAAPAAPQAQQSAAPPSQPAMFAPSQPAAVPGQQVADGQHQQAQPVNVDGQEQPAQPHGQTDANGMVPSFRVREETAARRAAEDQNRMLVQQNNEMMGMLRSLMQPQAEAPQAVQPPQVPDMYTDPAGYAAFVQERAAEQANAIMQEQGRRQHAEMASLKLSVSDQRAEATYGRDLIAAATQAAVQAGLKDRFMSTADPVGRAIEWYQGQVTAQRYGSDPTTVRTRVATELMNDPNFMAQMAQKFGIQIAPTAPNPSVPQGVPPPSLSAAPRNGQVMPAMPMQATQSALDSMFSQRRNSFSGQR